MINNPLFYSKTNITYPPFKNGLYLEEYFHKFISENNIYTKRKYIPAFWTNFQIEKNFHFHKNNMQQSLNEWVNKNPSTNGYFTIVQHANGQRLKLPENTIVYGGSTGDFPLPLIYEDKNNTLLNLKKKKIQGKINIMFICR
jgi:predicted nucleic acid binding AN1-type Zn finger protein